MENYTTEEQFKKEEIYLNLSKCTEEEQKHVFSLLPTEKDLGDYTVDQDFKYLNFDIPMDRWFVDNNEYENKTEITYPEFIKLFEGGERKEDFAIYKRTFNNIPYPRVEWECNCGFKHCLNEGFEQDYRKDNFKEIRLPNGNCLKCKKEIKTLYRKVAVSERLPLKSGFYFTYAKSGTKKTIWFMNEKFSYVSPSYSPDYWLEEVPEESQLKADKEELIENHFKLFRRLNSLVNRYKLGGFEDLLEKSREINRKHSEGGFNIVQSNP